MEVGPSLGVAQALEVVRALIVLASEEHFLEEPVQA